MASNILLTTRTFVAMLHEIMHRGCLWNDEVSI